MKRDWLDRIAFAIFLVMAWEVTSRFWGPYWISSPTLVAVRFWEMCRSGDLWFHGRYTLSEAIGGFVLGAFPGCVVAMVLRRHPFTRSAFLGVAAIGYAVPKTALVPLFILWLGVGPEAKVALVASAIIFIVFYSTLNGVNAVSEKLLLSASVFGATEWQLLRYIVWPSVVPYVFGGLRVAIPYAIAGAIVGEIISSNRGIGYLAQYGAMDFDTTLIFVSLFTVMMIVLTLNAALDFAQRRFLQWQSAELQATTPVGA